ncbi:MAG: hypothetical protein AAGJ40_23410 [Planctomycetota bacterium]
MLLSLIYLKSDLFLSFKEMLTPTLLAVSAYTFLMIFSANPNTLLPFAIGSLLAGAIRGFTDPDLVRESSDYGQTIVMPWVEAAMFSALMLLASYRRLLTAASLLVVCVAAVLCDARSIFAISVLSIAVNLITPEKLSRYLIATKSKLTTRLVLGFLVTAYVSYLGLVVVSSQGYLGLQRAAQIRSMRNALNPIEYAIRNGRSGLATSYVAILEEPIAGHGPGAKGRAIVAKTESQFQIRLSRSELAKYNWTIPTHSIILNAWVQCGIVAAVVWLYAFYLLVTAGLCSTVFPPRVKAWCIYSIISVCWALVFSPLSYGVRQQIAAMIAASLACSVSRSDVGQRLGLGYPPESRQTAFRAIEGYSQ